MKVVNRKTFEGVRKKEKRTPALVLNITPASLAKHERLACGYDLTFDLETVPLSPYDEHPTGHYVYESCYSSAYLILTGCCRVDMTRTDLIHSNSFDVFNLTRIENVTLSFSRLEWILSTSRHRTTFVCVCVCVCVLQIRENGTYCETRMYLCSSAKRELGFRRKFRVYIRALIEVFVVNFECTFER